jgi:phosphonate transport system substrate-binding protein
MTTMREESNPVENAGPGESKQLGPWGIWLALGCLVVAIALSIDAGVRVHWATANKNIAEAATVQAMGLVEPAEKTLAANFSDSQARLLADAPASPNQIADPPVLVLAHLESSDAENPSIPWNQLEAHLTEVTGRKVVDQDFDNSADQLADAAAGKITLVALHAADTPFLVNHYGFQPAAVLGDQSGANGNHLDLIVPANSSISNAADLRGHTLVCTVPSSITGYRAAVALLMRNESLRPNVDYSVIWSLGQTRSIQGVAKREYEAAAVSNDKLQSLVQSGKVDAKSYRVIYQSDVIPRTTIGWFYNLKPELAEQVRQAILSFVPKGQDAADTADTSGEALHFIAIDYKKNFQIVRQIDDCFDPRLDAKAKAAAHPATQPVQ